MGSLFLLDGLLDLRREVQMLSSRPVPGFGSGEFCPFRKLTGDTQKYKRKPVGEERTTEKTTKLVASAKGQVPLTAVVDEDFDGSQRREQ